MVTLGTAPIGTRAPAKMGGCWVKTARGWRWPGTGVHRVPGEDWTGELLPPVPPVPPVRHLFEREIERYLGDRVEAAGGRAYKWISPGHSGVPDRIVLLPGRPPQFVETKSPGRTLTAQQAREHKRLGKLGATVWVLDSRDGVDGFMGATA